MIKNKCIVCGPYDKPGYQDQIDGVTVPCFACNRREFEKLARDEVSSESDQKQNEAMCHEPVGDLIAGASSFVCMLPKDHKGVHRRGGRCLAHGTYIGDQCPEWPECVRKLAGQEALRASKELITGLDGILDAVNGGYLSVIRERVEEMLAKYRGYK